MKIPALTSERIMVEEKDLEILVLKNALPHQGKADLNSVVKSLVANHPEIRSQIKQLIPQLKELVQKVNNMNATQQESRLLELLPDADIEEIKSGGKTKREKEWRLPPLPNAQKGKVVTRFPPEPNGYLHLGHAKAAFIDYEYAKMYEGKFILRFDDTNPKNVQAEFYEAQLADLKWLGIEPNHVYNSSDNIETHYDLVRKLLTQGDAYVCNCPVEVMRENRKQGIACDCRTLSIEDNLQRFEAMHDPSKVKEGEMVVRLKGDLRHPNTTMRDPTLFRIIDHPHPKLGTKYRVWPTYDFVGAVEDSLSGVTHAFRSKEYELRLEAYHYLLDKLGMRHPHMAEFSRLDVEGMPVSKRKIKPLIERKIVDGFDDFRLPTLRGLSARGFVPEAIKRFVLAQGIGKTEGKVVLSALEAENRKILDSTTKRLYFVRNPRVAFIEEPVPEYSPHVELAYHPDNKELGSRKIPLDEHLVFYLDEEDANHLKKGEIFRLKGLFNVKVVDLPPAPEPIRLKWKGTKLIKESKKIQWVSANPVTVRMHVAEKLFLSITRKTSKKEKETIDVLNPTNMRTIEGWCEPAIINDFKTGEHAQFERIGFVKIKSISPNLVEVNFTHK